ncbi:MAG: GldG family protein [Opitutaceae bacterium]|nr:GldG family protein [Opitutaceae bacterium]
MSFADSFRAARWVRLINLVLQALLFTTLFAGLNYIAPFYFTRYDLTQFRRHSLSPETISYLTSLRAPVEIIVTLSEDDENEEVAQAARDLAGILKEYVYQTEGNVDAARGFDGRITVRFLDVYQRRRDAEQIEVGPNTVLVRSGDRRRVVGLEELYKIENRKKTAFQAEQALTAAILSVANPERKKIVFLLGHGEMHPDDVERTRGLSLLRDSLRLRNFDLEGMDLAQIRAIPKDALVIIPGPIARYGAPEVNLLRTWMSTDAGRLIVLLGPGTNHGLDRLLDEWGILADDVRIFDNGPDGQNEEGDLIMRGLNKDSPITASLHSNGLPVRFGTARPARPDPGRTPDAGLQVVPLVQTAASAWGERSYRLNIAPKYDPGVDLPGPIVVASSSERVVPPKESNLPFSVRGGRIVVFGCTDFIANDRIEAQGNLTVLLNAINWCVDRDAQLNVPAQPITRLQLSLTQKELSRLRYSLLLGVPGAAALLGLIVSWTRRR